MTPVKSSIAAGLFLPLNQSAACSRQNHAGQKNHWAVLACGLLILMLCCMVGPVHAGYQAPITWLKRTYNLYVRPDASTEQTVHWVIRIDNEAGAANYAERRLEFSGSLETLEVLEAFTQTPDGRQLMVGPDEIRTMEAYDEGGPEFSDAKVKVIIFPAVTVGAQLHLRYRRIQHTPFFPGHISWAEHYSPSVKYENASVTIRHERGLDLKVQGRGVVGGRVQAEDRDAPGTVRYAFTFRQGQPSPPELDRVDLTDFAPAVHVTTFADRADLAAAYQRAAYPKTEPTPSIHALAAELTTGAVSQKDKVQRLYNWVSRHVRYVSMAVGAGGFIPHTAQSILDHRYGDCKDHVVLLESLLRAVGIDSTPALVNQGSAMRLPELSLFSPFNHVITYVPSLGLFLDSTARFAPMGTLPAEVMDKPVLLTANGQVARTPRSSSESDFTHTRVWLQVMATGAVSGVTLALMGGAEEVDSRSAQFDNVGKDSEHLARYYLERFGETGTGEIFVGDPLDLGKPWKVESKFELDPVVNIPGPSAMAIPVGLAPGRLRGMVTSRPNSERRFASVCSSARHREEVDIQLPPTVQIERVPADVSFIRGPLRYSAIYRLVGNMVQISREMVAERASHICDVRDDQDWAALLRVLQRDLRGQVFLM